MAGNRFGRSTTSTTVLTPIMAESELYRGVAIVAFAGVGAWICLNRLLQPEDTAVLSTTSNAHSVRHSAHVTVAGASGTDTPAQLQMKPGAGGPTLKALQRVKNDVCFITCVR